MHAAGAAIHRGLAYLILAAVVVQFFLAGYGIFAGRTSDTDSSRVSEVSTLDPHRALGYLIFLAAVLLALSAVAAGYRGRDARLAGGLVLLTILQPFLASLGTDTGALFGGLHVLNALLILGLSAHIAVRARRRESG